MRSDQSAGEPKNLEAFTSMCTTKDYYGRAWFGEHGAFSVTFRRLHSHIERQRSIINNLLSELQQLAATAASASADVQPSGAAQDAAATGSFSAEGPTTAPIPTAPAQEGGGHVDAEEQFC